MIVSSPADEECVWLGSTLVVGTVVDCRVVDTVVDATDVVNAVVFSKRATIGSDGTMKDMVHAVALRVKGSIATQVPFLSMKGEILLLCIVQG